jgi:hypothetical protein
MVTAIQPGVKSIYIPFLLFDCFFFFSTPLLLLVSPDFSAAALVLVGAGFLLRACFNGAGFGGGSWDSMMGDAVKNTRGEGIVMVSAMKIQTLSRALAPSP